jgi:predicted phage-related endonuclease
MSKGCWIWSSMSSESEAWLKLRGNMLTASDAGTAIGVNKYETPDDLLRKKCGIGEKFTGNIYTEWGTTRTNRNQNV